MITAFNENAEDLKEIIALNKTISLENGKIKDAYCNHDHPFEITCTRSTSVKEIPSNLVRVDNVVIIYTDLEKIKTLPQDEISSVKGTVNKIYGVDPLWSPNYNRNFDEKIFRIKNAAGYLLDIDHWNNNVNLITEEDVGKRVKIINGSVAIFNDSPSIITSKGRIEIC